jgi:threonine/homoserine efflux transporter RhtA
MKVWKNKLVTILFALAGVLFLVPPVRQLIEGEPFNVTFLVLAGVFLIMSVAFGLRSDGAFGPHTPRPGHRVAGQEPVEK